MARSWPKPPAGAVAWSYSQLQDWSCPLHGHLKRDLGRRPLPSPALYKGRLAHEVIQRYCAHLMETGLPTDLDAVEAIARDVYFGRDGAESHGLGLDAWPEVLSLARSFALRWIHPVDRVLAQEEVWLLPVEGPHYLYVVLDLAVEDGDAVEVRDWKTDWHLRSLEEVEEDAQLAVYAWAVHQQFGAERVRCVLDFVRHGKSRAVDYDLDRIEAAGEAIRAEIERVTALRAAGRFPAVPGRACRYCDFTGECPAVQKAPEIVRIATPEEAEAVAGALTALERRRDVLRDALADWTSVAGPVTVGGVEWGHLLSQRQAVTDVAAFARRLESLGIEPWPYLRVETESLQRLLREDPGAREALADLLVDASTTSFRSRKAPAAPREAVAP